MPLSFDIGTPINTALFLYILYSVQRIIFPPILKTTTIQHDFRNGYSWMPKAHQPTVLFRIYTPTTLAAFSGHDGGRILLAINGIVFDVTTGRNFYGPRTFLSNVINYLILLKWFSFCNRGDVWKFCWKGCFTRNGEAIF